MDRNLAHDLDTLPELLEAAKEYAADFLASLDHRPVAGTVPQELAPRPLPEAGLGAEAVLRYFREQHDAGLSGSAGARYLGFVTGGTTPAALLGDWLVSAFDQNAQWNEDTVSPYLEHEALGWLAELLGIPQDFDGICVTGATMANFVGLATGRQWLGEQRGVDVSSAGLGAMPPIRVLAGAPHSSIYKALSMLGIGTGSVEKLPLLPGSESLDPTALGSRLEELAGEPVIVACTVGAVNNGDSDDLQAVGTLRREHSFWLHVDGAFGLVAAASPRYRHLSAGLEHADSITVDGHKWLNVPYDGGYSYTRHLASRLRVFRNAAPYLPPPVADPRNVLHLGPENSRRWRALPLWFTLLAYGQEGIREIVERCCDLAIELGRTAQELDGYELAVPVKLNVTCIEVEGAETLESLRELQRALIETGEVYATPSLYQGRPVMRMAFSNWRTEAGDVERIAAALAAVRGKSSPPPRSGIPGDAGWKELAAVGPRLRGARTGGSKLSTTADDLLARLRTTIEAWPETREKLSHGAPTWWGGSKTFATFANNHHGDGRIAVWVKSTFSEQSARVEAAPEIFFVPPYVGPSGWVGMRLDRDPEWPMVEELLEEGYRLVAPKRALAVLDGQRS